MISSFARVTLFLLINLHLQTSISAHFLKRLKCCLCRFRDKSSLSESSNKRYVITNPPSDFNLLPSDHVYDPISSYSPADLPLLQVFVLMQFDPGMEYQPGWGDGESLSDTERY